VTNVGTDKSHLATWQTKRKRHWRQKEKLEAFADRGTSKAERDLAAMRLITVTDAKTSDSEAEVEGSSARGTSAMLHEEEFIFVQPVRRSSTASERGNGWVLTR